jgi:hypothetical protein
MSTTQSGSEVMTDTSQVVEIETSYGKMLGALVLAAAATALSVAFALRLFPGIRAGSLAEFIGYGGVLFFGLGTIMAFRSLLRARGPIVTITSQGIRDTRVAAELIPWAAVHDISTWEYRKQRLMVLAVDPEVEKRLTLTRMARWTRNANRALGADGLCITAQGLKTDYDTLLRTSIDYLRASRAPM